MIATLIAAVTLSLKSPSDYTFTTPGTTNLTGVGMGPTPSYAIVRGEDISFLREAYEERFQAVRGESPTPGLNFGLPRTNDYAVTSFRSPNNLFGLAYLFSESFNPKDAGWHEYWFLLRGENNSYVSADYDFVKGDGAPVWCTTNWTFSVIPDEDLRRSYLPFINYSNRILPPDVLKTNAYNAVLTLMAITNAYHNLPLMHHILTAPGGTHNADPYAKWVSVQLPIVSTGLVSSAYSGYNVTYDYATYDYDGRTYQYPVSIKTQKPYSGGSSYHWATSHVEPPFASATWNFSVSYQSAIGWKRESPTTFRKMSVLEPIRWKGSSSNTPAANNPIIVCCDLITTNNVDLCHDIRALAVFGLRHKVTETQYTLYEQADRTSSVNEEFAVSAKRIGLTRNGHDAYGRITFTSDIELKPIFDAAAELFGEPNEEVAELLPRTSSVPETSDRPESDIVGYHGYDRGITIEWMRVIFLFGRDFKAKFE